MWLNRKTYNDIRNSIHKGSKVLKLMRDQLKERREMIENLQEENFHLRFENLRLKIKNMYGVKEHE